MEPNGTNSERRIIPPSADIHQEYPNVIYEQETSSPAFPVYIDATLKAMKAVGFRIAMAVEHDEQQGTFKYMVRTKETDRRKQSSQGALVLGLIEATRRRTESIGQTSPGNELVPQAADISRQLLHGLIDNKDMYEVFNSYYGGLREVVDQEKFVRAIFKYGSNYDEGEISANLNGHFLNSLVSELDIDISNNERNKWNHADPEKLLRKYKELDYKRLRDPKFRSSAEGQRLMDAYAKVLGQTLGNAYHRSERTITPDGRQLPRPHIPLSRYPIIEALMCEEVNLDRPKPRHGIGPGAVIDILTYSDSKQAHEALVRSINARLPQEYKRVYDGLDEFQHKRASIRSLLIAYKEYESDKAARKLLSDDLLAIVEGYTGQGETVTSVRDEYREYERRSGEMYTGHEVSEIKEIVGDIITVALGSPDGNLASKAEEIMRESLTDLFSFRQDELILLVFDSLKDFSPGGREAIVGQLGTDLFDDQTKGNQLAEMARLRQRIIELRNQPKVLQALSEVRKYVSDFGEKSAKEEAVKKNYDELTRPIAEMSEQLRRAKNEFILGTIRQLISGEPNSLFSELVNRLEIQHYGLTSLPEEYFALMDIAKTPGLSDGNKSEIAWHVAKQFDDVSIESAYLMVPAMVDLYQVMLGSPDNVNMPNNEISHGLAAVTYLVRKHSREMFKSVSMEDLKLLNSYAEGLRQHATRVASGEVLPEHTGERVDTIKFQEWQGDKVHEIKRSIKELARVIEYYNEYSHPEAVES